MQAMKRKGTPMSKLVTSSIILILVVIALVKGLSYLMNSGILR